MDPTSLYRDKIGERLARRLAHAFQDQEITREQLQEISRFILDSLDAAKTNEQLYAFLEEVSSKWPILRDVLIVEKAEEKEEKKEEVVKKVEDLIHSENLDQALKVATAANQDAGGTQNG